MLFGNQHWRTLCYGRKLLWRFQLGKNQPWGLLILPNRLWRLQILRNLLLGLLIQRNLCVLLILRNLLWEPWPDRKEYPLRAPSLADPTLCNSSSAEPVFMAPTPEEPSPWVLVPGKLAARSSFLFFLSCVVDLWFYWFVREKNSWSPLNHSFNSTLRPTWQQCWYRSWTLCLISRYHW